MAEPGAQRALPDVEIERLVRSGTEELLIRVGGAFGAQQGWANQLRAVAYELRDFLREDEVRARAMMVEVLGSTTGAIAIREQGTQALVELIDLGRQELDDPDSLPRSVAEITAGVIYNRIHVALERGAQTLDEEMVRELMYSAVLPYLGGEAALAELDAPRP